MPVDPQVQVLLDQMAAAPAVDMTQLDPAVAREAFSQVGPQGEPVEVGSVVDRGIPGPAGDIPVRVYTPPGATEGPLPLLLFFHGGGFVVCGLDSHDGLARELCVGAGAIVVSVDYRLAPEHKFPAGPEDCHAALAWAVDHAAELGADPARVAVAGDSAGGNLSAVVALMARDRGGPAIAHQLLIYPVCEHRFDTASYVDNAEGFFLTRDMMRWFWGHYLAKEEDGKNPLASPLLAPDLSGLPPATVITAELDPLRDEGEAYGQRLGEAGVAVASRRYDGVIHGFVSMSAVIDQGGDAIAWSCERLREAFAA